MAKERMLAKVKIGEKWKTVGSAFRFDSGQVNIVLEVVPVSNWNGHLVLFPDERGGEGAKP